MWETFSGKVLAVVVVSAALSGIYDFTTQKVFPAVEFAAPYVTAVAKTGIALSDRLILFTNGVRHNQPLILGDLSLNSCIVPDTNEPPPQGVAEYRFDPKLPLRHSSVELTVWRIGHRNLLPLALGSSPIGSRWLSSGRGALYAAGSILAAIDEVFADRLRQKDFLISMEDAKARVLHEIRVRGSIASCGIDAASLGGTSQEAIRRIGNRWLQDGRIAILMIPSRLDSKRINYLINPAANPLPDLTVMRSVELIDVLPPNAVLL